MSSPDRSTSSRKYWFPAKRYGWGWGVPATWQGWVVFIAYLVLLAGGSLILKGNPASTALYVGYVLVISALLTAICWWKGEPPRWRWGDE